jgi:hypothetical protein
MQGDIQSTDHHNLDNNWFKSENYTRNMTYNGSETIVTYEPYELPKGFIITFISLYAIMIFGSVGGIRTLALGFVIRFLSGLEITKWRSHATATIVNARCNTVTI